MNKKYQTTLITRDGRSVPITHRLFETKSAAQNYVNSMVAESDYCSGKVNEVKIKDSDQVFDLTQKALAYKKNMIKFEKASGSDADEKFIKARTSFINALKKLKALDLPESELNKLRKGTHIGSNHVKSDSKQDVNESFTKKISRAANRRTFGENEEPVNEDIATDAVSMEHDHEVQMARGQLYHAAKDAMRLHKMLKSVSEAQGLEGWVAAKITRAADYLNSVADYMEYELVGSAIDSVIPDRVAMETTPINEADVVDFSAFAGMYSDGARTTFTGRDGKTHTLAATGDRPRKYYINGKEVSWQEVKRQVGNQKLYPRQGMMETTPINEAMKLSKDQIILSEPGAEKFAKHYRAGMMGDYRDGGPTEQDQRNTDKFWNLYDSTRLRSGFAGSGTTRYTNKKTGESFIVDISPNGKGFYGNNHSISVDSQVNETAYEKDLDDNKPIVVRGVKGAQSKPFRKKFRNMAAYEKWSDTDAADDYEVHDVMNESVTKKISRAVKGWSKTTPMGDPGAPKDVVNRVEALSDKDLLDWSKSNRKIAKGSPADLQMRAINREIKRRGLGETTAKEIYTGRETKADTWRVFQSGNPVAVAGPFKSKEETAEWIKKQKQNSTRKSTVETTTAGSVAAVAMPLGAKPLRRSKNSQGKKKK